MRNSSQDPIGRLATGVEGLDHVLAGGLPAHRLYLVLGDPGVGKTTLALQFLLDGARQREPGVYITLSETEEELRAVARSHGWSLDGIDVCELNADDDNLRADSQYTMFHPAEVELSETTRRLVEIIERVKPTRVVLDSLSEMRLIASDPLRYRRQILALKQFFVGRNATVMLLDDGTADGRDLQLQSLAHGVIELEQTAPEYGAERRRIRIVKLRGVKYRGGYHDIAIRTEGVVVYPRLVAAEHQEPFRSKQISSGVAELDQLLGGGLSKGASTLFIGPAGCGKSVLASQFIAAASARGDRTALFTFDEGVHALFLRAQKLGIPLGDFAERGLLNARQVDPAELTPGELSAAVRVAVERDGARVVVIDSLNGYLNATPGERHLTIHLHELLSYLGQMGVATIITLAQHGLMGDRMASPIDVSYLSDTVVMLRYFEFGGQVRKAISVIKHRLGAHEPTIRELMIGPVGVRVGPALTDFRGVLSGVPNYHGGGVKLLEPTHDDG